MDRQLIQNLPQLLPLFESIKRAKLDKVVWTVLGGIPRRYVALGSTLVKNAGRGTHILLNLDERSVIGDFLLKEIGDAIKLVDKSAIAHPHLEEIFTLFDDSFRIPSSELRVKKLKRPEPDKVLREVKIDGELFLVPATNAIGIVMRHTLTKEPSLAKLEEMIS
jgi:hypothetical protein